MNNLYSAVKYLSELLKDEVEPWAITGGCNLFLRGCTRQTGDIDIITSKKGVEIIAERLGGESIEINKSESGSIRSYFYTSLIKGLTVEVMGAPENKVNEVWVKNNVWLKLIEVVVIDSVRIPAESLDYELYIQSLIGSENKTQLIKKCITKASTQTP